MSNIHKRKAKTLNQIAQTNFWGVNILFMQEGVISLIM
jgi:hypothetical protein